MDMIIDAPTACDIPALRALWKQAFGDTDEFLDAFFDTAFSSERARRVSIDGKTVAALYWFECTCRGERIAYIYAVATDNRFRGRGLCTALMENTRAQLEALGYKAAVLVPGSFELFDFYKKRGYVTCSRVSELCVSAKKGSALVREIETDEYARLRREYLPVGGVEHSIEAICFLSTQSRLFATEKALLAARIEGDTLACVELLGDVSEAESIVYALGCAEGRFRTVGEQRDFAMYLPLGEKKIVPPTYFGLAFD